MPKKKIVKATPREHAIISERLRKKHPHMFKEDWVKSLKKNVRLLLGQEKFARGETARTQAITKQLRRSGLTDAEIEKFKSSGRKTK